MENINECSLYIQYLLEFLISVCSLINGQAKVMKSAFYEINNMFIKGFGRSDILQVGDLNSVQKNNDIKISYTFTSFLGPVFNKCKEEGEFQMNTLESEEKINKLSEDLIEIYGNLIHKLTKNTINF